MESEDHFCECGCGAETAICGQTNNALGHVKGEPLRFLSGHNPTTRAFYAEDENGCWIWQGHLNEHGYGRMKANGTRVYAHRHYFEQAHGPIPEDCNLDHLCRVPACCNPAHLQAVPQAINVRRGKGTKLTEEKVRAIRALAGLLPAKSLAAEYGVVPRTISQIWARETWADV